jgi:hypothetical protein
MAYNTRTLLLDANGRPIPQLYNPVTDEFEPLQGSTTGGMNVQITGSEVIPVTILPTTGAGVTLPLAGTLQPPGGSKTLRLAVKGTGSYSFQIQGLMDGVISSIPAWDISNKGFLTGNNIVAGGIYDIDVQGFDNVQAYLTALSGGNVTVTGRWLGA